MGLAQTVANAALLLLDDELYDVMQLDLEEMAGHAALLAECEAALAEAARPTAEAMDDYDDSREFATAASALRELRSLLAGAAPQEAA